MEKPPRDPPLAVRFRPDVKAALAAWAEREGKNRNRAVQDLVALGLSAHAAGWKPGDPSPTPKASSGDRLERAKAAAAPKGGVVPAAEVKPPTIEDVVEATKPLADAVAARPKSLMAKMAEAEGRESRAYVPKADTMPSWLKGKPEKKGGSK